MRRFLIIGWLMILLVGIYPQPVSVHSQISAFAAGDWVITTQELEVYALATTSSTNISTLPEGLYLRITREPVFFEDRFWFYIENHVYGWVSQPPNNSIFMQVTSSTLDKLITQYTNRIEVNASDFEAYRLRAFIYFAQKEYLKAIEDLQEYINNLYSRETGYWEGWLGKFYLDFNHPDYDYEAELYLFSAQIGPDGSEDILIKIWQALYEDVMLPGFPIMTANTYFEVMRLAPDWAYPIYLLGMRTYVVNNFRSAEAYFQQALELDPQFTPALIRLGDIQLDQGYPEDSIDFFDQALAINPYSGWAHVERADAYWALRQPSNAVDDYLKAIELDPNNDYIRARFGTYNVQAGNFRQALEQFDIAIELNTSIYYVYVNKAYAHAYLGEYEDAVEPIQIGIDLSNRSPNTADLALNYFAGQLYLKLDQYEEAEHQLLSFSRGWENSTDRPWGVITNIMLGRVQVELGKYDEAIATYEYAFSLNRNVALNYVGWVGEYRRVIVVTNDDVIRAQRAVDNDPNNAELYLELGKEQLELGYWLDAIANFRTYDVLADDVPDEFNAFVDALENIVLER